MSNRIFIIGAGFSKAIADAPLANDLFREIYENFLKDYDDSPRRFSEFSIFSKIVNHLQTQIIPSANALKKDGTNIKQLRRPFKWYPLNVEYLISLIDLNIQSPHQFKSNNADLSLYNVPYIKGLKELELKEVKNLIKHYIVKVLSPFNLKPDEQELKKFVKIINNDDTVITFNYDIIIEQGLWLKGLWNPIEGYGIGKNFSRRIPRE